MANPPPQQQQPDFNSLLQQYQATNADQADATAFGIPAGLVNADVRTGNIMPSDKMGILGGSEDTHISILDALRTLSSIGPDQLQALQRNLYNGGFFSDTYYNKNGPPIHYGVLDDATIAAYKQAVVDAYRTGGKQSIAGVIGQGVSAGYGKAMQATGAAPPPLVIQLTNPDNIKATADQVAKKTLGRRLSPQELQNFVDTFHSNEMQAQQQDWQAKYGNMGVDAQTGTPRGPGGTITAPPNLDASFIDAMLRRNDPNEANAQDTHAALNVAAGMLGGKL